VLITNEVSERQANPTSRTLVGADLKFERFDDAHEKVF
jgi:hypothetical protein